jgi:hypothetical protein
LRAALDGIVYYAAVRDSGQNPPVNGSSRLTHAGKMTHRGNFFNVRWVRHDAFVLRRGEDLERLVKRYGPVTVRRGRRQGGGQQPLRRSRLALAGWLESAADEAALAAHQDICRVAVVGISGVKS